MSRGVPMSSAKQWLPYDDAMRIVRSERRRKAVKQMKAALPSWSDAEVERAHPVTWKRKPYVKPELREQGPYDAAIDCEDMFGMNGGAW